MIGIITSRASYGSQSIAQEPAPMMHRESGSYFHFLLRGWLIS